MFPEKDELSYNNNIIIINITYDCGNTHTLGGVSETERKQPDLESVDFCV